MVSPVVAFRQNDHMLQDLAQAFKVIIPLYSQPAADEELVCMKVEDDKALGLLEADDPTYPLVIEVEGTVSCLTKEFG